MHRFFNHGAVSKRFAGDERVVLRRHVERRRADLPRDAKRARLPVVFAGIRKELSTPFPYSVFHLYVSTLSGRVNVRSNDPDFLAMKIHALFAALRALERGRRPFSLPHASSMILRMEAGKRHSKKVRLVVLVDRGLDHR